jgi:hypothetical protein
VDVLWKRFETKARPGFFLKGARVSTGTKMEQASCAAGFSPLSATSTVAAATAVFLYLLEIEKAVQ